MTDREAAQLLRKLLALQPGFALVGSLMHSAHMPEQRVCQSHDIDIIVGTETALSPELNDAFLVNHYHPEAKPGQLLLQLVDVSIAVRIDVFKAHSGAMERSHSADLFGLTVPVLSMPDGIAKLASLLLALDVNDDVPKKHADQFRVLSPRVSLDEVANIWPCYRKPHHPAAYSDAVGLISNFIETQQHLLVDPVYSTDINETCHRCEENGRFPLSPKHRVFSVLGYV